MRGLFLQFLAFLLVSGAMAKPISYRHDVVPVLIKTGCNMGACHGAQTGKGELLLSLRGEDPVKDHAALLKAFVDKAAPEKSFMLRKPLLAGGVKHEGGKRFEEGSEAHQILRDWIAQGAVLDLPDEPTLEKILVDPPGKVFFAPETEVSLTVTAHYSDGTSKPVNQWAIYEPTSLNVEVSEDGHVTSLRPGETIVNVRFLGKQRPVPLAFVAANPGYVWNDPPASNFIDEHLHEKWQLMRLSPSEVCDDSTFVRRIYLDLTGRIPTADEARKFVADSNPDKRVAIVDQLMERSDFAYFWALKWADLLRLEERTMDRKGTGLFHNWIRQSIIDNKPVDQFAREILSAIGSTYENAPSNYYRALRNPSDRAEAVSQVFMGTRLGCAKCHNHPFEKWTMDDYYEFASVFDGLDYKIIENKRKDKNDKKNFVGEQVVQLVDKRVLKHPRTGEPPPARFLEASSALAVDDKKRLDKMAAWLTSRENPLFARVQANRIWSHLMGRGIVEPVDDFRKTNPPVNPALLDALTADFIESGFDMRHLIRTICASQAYQLSSVPNDDNVHDEINFTRNLPRRLTAEQLLDSVHHAMGTKSKFNGFDDPIRAQQLPGTRAVYRDYNPSHDDLFVKLFGKPPRLTNSDTERSSETSLAQIFELTSGKTLNTVLTTDGNLLSRVEKLENDAKIEEMYWMILSREPTREERMAASYFLRNAENGRAALEDLAWALLNAKEFLLRD